MMTRLSERTKDLLTWLLVAGVVGFGGFYVVACDGGNYGDSTQLPAPTPASTPEPYRSAWQQPITNDTLR